MRAYPDRPIVGVGAVIVLDGGVVLVRRRQEPLAGAWSLPGGAVELGETLHDAVVREVSEETGLEVSVGPIIEVIDRIHRDVAGRILYHYVLVDYICRPTGGMAAAASDAAALAVVDASELDAYDLNPVTRRVIDRGLEVARRHAAG